LLPLGVALVLIWMSPTIQVDLLKNPTAMLSLKNPGIITVPLSFVVGIVVSLLFPEPEAEAKYAEVERRMHLGAEEGEPAAAE